MLARERFKNVAKMDCINAIEFFHNKPDSKDHHWKCKQKDIAITEPVDNSYDTVPLKRGKVIAYMDQKTEWLFGLYKRNKKYPIFEWYHPCDNCEYYVKDKR